MNPVIDHKKSLQHFVAVYEERATWTPNYAASVSVSMPNAAHLFKCPGTVELIRI
jgi:hypothetical protein